MALTSSNHLRKIGRSPKSAVPTRIEAQADYQYVAQSGMRPLMPMCHAEATQPDAKRTASDKSWSLAKFFTAAPARWEL
jgi:hypothetical protein